MSSARTNFDEEMERAIKESTRIAEMATHHKLQREKQEAADLKRAMTLSTVPDDDFVLQAETQKIAWYKEVVKNNLTSLECATFQRQNKQISSSQFTASCEAINRMVNDALSSIFQSQIIINEILSRRSLPIYIRTKDIKEFKTAVLAQLKTDHLEEAHKQKMMEKERLIALEREARRVADEKNSI